MYETVIERWDRIGVKYNILREEENGTLVNNCKKGNLSFKMAEFIKHPVTMLITCQVCGKRSTPKKVHSRTLCYRWNVIDKKDYKTESKDVLCMGCWNKVRAILKHEDNVNKNRKLINKLNKERLKWLKSQMQAN